MRVNLSHRKVQREFHKTLTFQMIQRMPKGERYETISCMCVSVAVTSVFQARLKLEFEHVKRREFELNEKNLKHLHEELLEKLFASFYSCNSNLKRTLSFYHSGFP